MPRALCVCLLIGCSVCSIADSGNNQSQSNSPGQSGAPAAVSTLPQAATNAGLAAAPGAAVPNPLGDAKACYLKGDFEHAIEKYQQLLQERPKSPDAYAGLTRVYLKKKDVAKANETITKALEVANSPVVRVALGEVYFRQGKIPEAEREWVNVINAGYPNAWAYMGLARVRWALSMYKSGWSMIAKAHEMDPTDPEITGLWSRRLSRAERIKYLEESLAAESYEDEETRAHMRQYLEYLKARTKDPRGACHLAGKSTSTQTELVRLLLDPQHLRGYGLSVAVNGQKSKLLLDTGASGIMINRNLAVKAGVHRLSDVDIRGIGDKGNRAGYLGLADSLKIGDLEFKDCPVRVLEDRSVAGEDGLIGADVFDAFLVEIDFPGEKLYLRELPKRPGEGSTNIALHADADDSDSGSGSERPQKDDSTNTKNDSSQAPALQDRYIAPEMKSWTQVYRFGHYLLVPTRIGEIPPKLFLLDTGAFSNLISTDAAREVTKVQGNSGMIVKGISGSVKNVYSADKAILQFGHLRQENQDLTAFDMTSMSNGAGTDVSGLLGFAMLRLLDIKIDYRDGLVDFTYDPKRW